MTVFVLAMAFFLWGELGQGASETARQADQARAAAATEAVREWRRPGSIRGRMGTHDPSVFVDPGEGGDCPGGLPGVGHPLPVRVAGLGEDAGLPHAVGDRSWGSRPECPGEAPGADAGETWRTWRTGDPGDPETDEHWSHSPRWAFCEAHRAEGLYPVAADLIERRCGTGAPGQAFCQENPDACEGDEVKQAAAPACAESARLDVRWEAERLWDCDAIKDADERVYLPERDTDGDGTPDAEDAYPMDAACQAAPDPACDDSDGDGKGDGEDDYPEDPRCHSAPDPVCDDSDGDGVPDGEDVYPHDEVCGGPLDTEERGCSDEDGDGVSDRLDGYWNDHECWMYPDPVCDAKGWLARPDRDGDGEFDPYDEYPDDSRCQRAPDEVCDPPKPLGLPWQHPEGSDLGNFERLIAESVAALGDPNFRTEILLRGGDLEVYVYVCQAGPLPASFAAGVDAVALDVWADPGAREWRETPGGAEIQAVSPFPGDPRGCVE